MSGSEDEDTNVLFIDGLAYEKNKKKKRSANFTPRESILLMTLVSDLKDVIENKKTDGVSMQEKKLAWQKITSAFNSTNPESLHRTTESLKKMYDNKKREVRKQKAEEKKDILLTGGGPSLKTIKDPYQDLIMSIVDPLTIVGDKSYYGSDSLPFNTKISDQAFEFELENPIIGENQDENLSLSTPFHNKQESGDPEPELIEFNSQNNNDSTNVEEARWKKDSDLRKPKSLSLRRHGEELETQDPEWIILNSQYKNDAANLEQANWKKGSDLRKSKSLPLKRPRNVLALPRNNNNQNEKNNNPEIGNINKENHINPCVKNNNNGRSMDRRRPTQTVIKSLASSQLAETYNQLAQKKTSVAEHILKKIKKETENSQKEHDLRVEALKLDIEIKKENLKALRK